jgi:nickel-dependent lactate racemase
MYQAASLGMGMVDELMACSVRPEKYIIVSPGGLREGRDMYHAQRGLELTRNAVLEGGEILFVAEMSGGIAYDDSTRLNFHERLKQPEKLHLKREDYVLYCHKAVRLHELMKKVDKIHVFSSLDDASLREIRMEPVGSCQDVVDEWLDKDSDAKILVFNSANRLAVYQKEDPVS